MDILPTGLIDRNAPPYSSGVTRLPAQVRMRALSSRSLTKLLLCARSNERTRRRLEAIGISVTSIRTELNKREQDVPLAGGAA